MGELNLSIPSPTDPSINESNLKENLSPLGDEAEKPPLPEALKNRLLTQCRQGATMAIAGMKQIPAAVKDALVGPKPIYRQAKFWVGLGVVSVGGGAIAISIAWNALDQSLPDNTEDVLTFVRPDTVTIKAADGTIIQQIGPATHDTLKIWEIPEQLKQAFISSEDQRFLEHDGLDYQGILRATTSNIVARDLVEGGSTLTQQLARIVYFDQSRSMGRKVKEMRMAQKIEEDLTKDQIIERYLNLVYLGSGAYGVADAAWVYFSKPVKDLTLPEMAMLAALPPAPTVYSPLVNEKVAKERRDVVLKRMEDMKYITAAQAKDAIATPLNIKPSNPKRLDREAYYFTEYIQQELPKYVSKEVLAKKGLTVETTLNLDWQKAAEAAVTKTIENRGPGQGFKQAALVAIDPRSGQIKAMVGGKDFYNQQFNRVTQAQRQPGSTFKPFVYGTGIAGGFSPYRGYEDAPFIVDGYEPKNYGGTFRGWTNIKDALTKSVNIVAVKALIDIGWDPVINVAHKMGIESELKPTYSLALGASEVNLLELTSAYGTFANKGVHVKPHGIRRILDPQGKIIYQDKSQGEQAIDPDTSAIMTWMMRDVVTDGTGGNAQLSDRAVAGKTGTSDEARDLWFIGYIPQLVTGVWLGNDDNKPTWGASSTAAYTWNKFMVKAVENMKVEKFPERPSLENRKPTIDIKKLKPKRTISKPIPQAEDASDNNSANSYNSQRTYRRSTRRSSDDDNSQRTYRRSTRRSYQRTSDNSDNSGSQTRSSRRTRRTSRNTTSNSDETPRRATQTTRRRYYNQSQSQQTTEQPTRRARRRVRTENSISSGSSSRSSSSRRRSQSSRSSNSNSSGTPRSQPRLESAPAAPPPAPPASRKS
ncbi:MAG TPA: penicillin-binding protein [Cyanobacteria bacterium UBA11149]|nr:penicillin-binding protein [Cyanobacteria bacterium UBA11367]HBE56420.1 penicillin-binding protein [Cyanobacteria bacterium UBA11366]HBK66559.1 penicillin-binding protein [Cyanobacteria bacterium UBA11166]HBR72950.1 penicillin-binding protein [Cyanobacteria bacterium UBA11159]HBS70901.1 penicillin-binding protein [Cyanobacteria bacterium UBA11153]HBW89269.1 penicillin-binding protein [Cyanobacteria bacterium UBA11149]HCA97447.1 penicillin-binding protein [Cyanobacteria bacterium UBA9226]